MIVSGIPGPSFSNPNPPSVWNRRQEFRQDFEQLGQDLQSGNISAAQSDFAAIQQLQPQTNSTQQSQNSNPVQAFHQLGLDVQSGNTIAARKDFTTIQQALQSQGAHHHHHLGAGGSNIVNQLLSQLGQTLQGPPPTAKQAYGSLQEESQLAVGNELFAPLTSLGGSTGISVSA